MSPDAKKKLIGALVAAAMAFAVAYGLIDQKQADTIKTQVDQTLGTSPNGQQPQQAPAPAPQQGQATTPAPTPQSGQATTQAPAPPSAPAPAPAPQSSPQKP